MLTPAGLGLFLYVFFLTVLLPCCSQFLAHKSISISDGSANKNCPKIRRPWIFWIRETKRYGVVRSAHSPLPPNYWSWRERKRERETERERDRDRDTEREQTDRDTDSVQMIMYV
jgi:hypothetical protein